MIAPISMIVHRLPITTYIDRWTKKKLNNGVYRSDAGDYWV